MTQGQRSYRRYKRFERLFKIYSTSEPTEKSSRSIIAANESRVSTHRDGSIRVRIDSIDMTPCVTQSVGRCVTTTTADKSCSHAAPYSDSLGCLKWQAHSMLLVPPWDRSPPSPSSTSEWVSTPPGLAIAQGSNRARGRRDVNG